MSAEQASDIQRQCDEEADEILQRNNVANVRRPSSHTVCRRSHDLYCSHTVHVHVMYMYILLCTMDVRIYSCLVVLQGRVIVRSEKSLDLIKKLTSLLLQIKVKTASKYAL